MPTTRFTKEHEWVRVDGQTGTVGITDYAQKQLGDIVFVELPTIGAVFKQGTQAAVVESVKAASEVYAPVSGEVIAVNEALSEDPGRVNGAPMGEGWFFQVIVSDPSELDALMDQESYGALLASLD